MNMNAKDVVKVIPRGNGDVMVLGVVAILALGIAAYVFVKGGEKRKVGGASVNGDVEKKKRERNVNVSEDVKERNENTTTNVNTSANTKKDNKHKGKKEIKSTKQVTPVKTQHSGNAVDNQQQQQQQPVINTPTLSQANVQEIITNISVIKTDKPQKEPVVTSNDDVHANTTTINNNNKVNTNDVDVVNKNVLVEDIITTVVPPIDITPPELQASKVEVNTTTTANETEQPKPKAKKNKKKKPAKKEPKQQQQEPNLSLEENINDDDSGWIEVGSKKDKPSTQTKQKQIAQIYKDYLNQY